MIPYYDKVSEFPSTLRNGWTLALAAGIWALAACGSNQPVPGAGPQVERASGPPLAKAAAPDGRAVVVAFGDSLTAGHGVGRDESYPAFLQRELDRRGLEFRVVNEGVSGDTTAKALSRIEIALSHAPEWVILGLGANDGLRGLPIDAMEENLAQMIGNFEAGGARILLAGMMLPRNYGPEYVAEFEGVYPRLAERFDLPLIPFLLRGVAMVRELNNRDGIHPNAEGNRIVARTVADAFEAAARK